MDENQFLDKFKEKFGTKKEQNETGDAEEIQNENDLKKENNMNNVETNNNNDNNRNMEGGRVSKLFLRNMYKSQLADIKEEIKKEKIIENKNKQKKQKDKDKDDSIGDYSLSSEEDEQKENEKENEENKNIIPENLNSYFTSSKNKQNENINISNKPKNEERTSISKQQMLKYIQNLNKNEEKNKSQNKNDINSNLSNNQNNYIRQVSDQPRPSVKDILKLNEERIKLLKEEREKYNIRNSVYAKNRANWRLKMKKISDYIKSEKEEGQTNEEFFSENEDYLKKFGITNVKDFISIQEILDKYDYNLEDEKIRKSAYLPSNPYKNKLKVIKDEIEKKDSNSNLVKENKFISFNSNNISTPKNYNLTNQIVNGLEDDIKEKISYIVIPKKTVYETSHIENNIISKKTKKNKFTDLNTNMDIINKNFNIKQIPKINKYNEELLSREEFTPINILKTQNTKLQFRKCESNVEINYYPKKTIKEIQNEISIDINKTYERKKSNFIVDNNPNEKIEYIVSPLLKRYKSENISIEKPSFIGLSSIPKKSKFQICYEDNDSLLNTNTKKYSNFDLTICHDVNNFYYKNRPSNKNYVIKKQESQGSVNSTPKKKNSISKEIKDFSYISELNNNNEIKKTENYKNNQNYNEKNDLNNNITNNKNNIINNELYNNRYNNDFNYNYKEKNNNNYEKNHNNRYNDVKNNNENDYRINNYQNSNNQIHSFNNFDGEIVNNKNNKEIKLKSKALPNTTQNLSNNSIQKVLQSKDITNKYQKNIITSLDNIQIMKYQISDSAIPLDPSFLDVLCINCYECIKMEDMDLHSQKCVIKLEYFKDNAYDEDYNTRIFKLHESLKNKKEEIENTKDKNLLNFYNRLLKIIYQILINNNSIEELDSSITEINKMIKNDINKGNFSQNYKFYFLLFCQRISQLVYMKLKDMEKIILSLNQNSSKDSIDSIEEDYNLNNNLEDDEHIKYMKEQLTSIENETNKAKNELKQWKKEAKLLENTLRKPNIQRNEQLSDIASDINSRNESYDYLTTFTGQMSDIGDNEINEEDFDNFSEDEQKKYFLSVGLGIKFKYSDQIQEDVSIAQLFDKAKNKGVKPQNYHDFLIKELNIK